MRFDSEGIILKQVKLPNGVRLTVLFSEKFGKISAGSRINEGGKNKSALAMRPFTYGRYSGFKNRDTYTVDSAETIRSYYGIGEDIDKYMAASYIVELTEKITPYDQPMPALLSLLKDFLNLLEIRKKGYDTLVCAYIVKAVKIMGLMPQLERCAVCGCSIDSPETLSVGDGGIVCKKCTENTENKGNDTLIYKVSFDIVEVLKYFAKKPISDFKNLVLEEDMQHKVMAIIKSYISYHLDVGTLKSESLMVKNSGR